MFVGKLLSIDSYIARLVFDITADIIDKGNHQMKILSSMVLWPKLQTQLAELFNVYPTSLHTQYCLSTDPKECLPCDLMCQDQLNMMVKLLKPLIVPPRLKGGKRSTRKMKPVSVQLFNKGNDPNNIPKAPGAGKVILTPSTYQLLTKFDRKLHLDL
jgi:hypothetical protein